MLSSIITWGYYDQPNQTDGIAMSNFITNLAWHKNVLLLLGRPNLPFDDASITIRDLLLQPLVKVDVWFATFPTILFYL